MTTPISFRPTDKAEARLAEYARTHPQASRQDAINAFIELEPPKRTEPSDDEPEDNTPDDEDTKRKARGCWNCPLYRQALFEQKLINEISIPRGAKLEPFPTL